MPYVFLTCFDVMAEYPAKSCFQKEEFVFGSQFQGRVFHGREGMAAGLEAGGHVVPAVRKHRKECWFFSELSPLYSDQDPSLWNSAVISESWVFPPHLT